jgi:hypothetical protein
MSASALPVFKVVLHPNNACSVNMTMANGHLKTIDGFGSEHEASAWIVQTERMFFAADPRLHPAHREGSH